MSITKFTAKDAIGMQLDGILTKIQMCTEVGQQVVCLSEKPSHEIESFIKSLGFNIEHVTYVHGVFIKKVIYAHCLITWGTYDKP